MDHGSLDKTELMTLVETLKSSHDDLVCKFATINAERNFFCDTSLELQNEVTRLKDIHVNDKEYSDFISSENERLKRKLRLTRNPRLLKISSVKTSR